MKFAHYKTAPLLVEIKLVILTCPLHLARVRVLEIALDNVVSVFPDSAEAGLLHDGGDDGAGQGVVSDDKAVEVDLRCETHLARDGAEDESSLSAVAEAGEFDLSVEATRTEQGRVECIGTVGGHDNLDVRGLVKAVHLVQKLEENTLNFTIGAGLSIETFGCDGVDLVDEDNTWRVLASHAEDIADHTRTLAEVFLDKFGANNANETGRGRVRDSFHKHSLARSRWTVQKHTAGRINANLSVEIKLSERQLDSLTDFLLLHIQTTNIRVSDVRLFVGAEHGDRGVGFGRQDVDESIGMAMKSDG